MARRERLRRDLLSRHGWFAALVLAAGGLVLAGQAPEPPTQELFLTNEVRAAAAAAAVVAAGHPLTAASVVVRGQDTSAWQVETAAPAAKPRSPDAAPVLDPDVLANVDDRKPLANADVNPDEVRAYYYALLTAHRTPAEVLFKSARRDLSYAHLFEDTDELRGQLVYLEGRLVRLRRYEPPHHLKKEGVKDQYEGWIFDKRYEGDPMSHCLVFTELPAGIKVGENVDYPVAFAGYLFKRYRVRSKTSAFDAPLLIGRTVTLIKDTPAGGTTSEMRRAFLIGFIAVGLVTVGVIGGLAWWYRRNDREVRDRLAQVRPPAFDDADEHGSANGRS